MNGGLKRPKILRKWKGYQSKALKRAQNPEIVEGIQIEGLKKGPNPKQIVEEFY